MYTRQELREIYDRTSGYCHLCGQKVYFTNYAKPGSRGAWEVEHSHARAHGGTERINNKYPAHIDCNRDKGIVTTRAARARHGRTKAPLSRERRAAAKRESAVAGGLIGAAVGSLAGPVGALVCGGLGAYIGHKQNPDR
jgi:5-methylcytosine-specific restriction endonuclease McrA